jgi:hypothetical protein
LDDDLRAIENVVGELTGPGGAGPGLIPRRRSGGAGPGLIRGGLGSG